MHTGPANRQGPVLWVRRWSPDGGNDAGRLGDGIHVGEDLAVQSHAALAVQAPCFALAPTQAGLARKIDSLGAVVSCRRKTILLSQSDADGSGIEAIVNVATSTIIGSGLILFDRDVCVYVSKSLI